MQLPERKVALAFLAHPDDAEFQCGGTLALLSQAGWEVHIATASPGDKGTTIHTPEEIAAIRRAEGAAAAQLIGAQYHCLEERDLNVVFDRTSIPKAIDLMRSLAPSLVITHPRLDYMLDHEQTHLLARAAAFAYPIPNASILPVAPGSSVPWMYYCDPPEMIDPYSGARVKPTTYVDVSQVMPTKTAMLAAHASQREWLRAHHGMDEYIDSMHRHAAARGAEIGVRYAEGFVQHLGHPHPRTNLLAAVIGATALLRDSARRVR